MKIGIAYDTSDMYNLGNDSKLHFDFAELSAINVLKREFESLGHKVELLGNAEHVLHQIKSGLFSCDLVYNTVEGVQSRNREGLLPSLLEIRGIPYIGTDSFGLSLTLDKRLTKILARHLGILTPDFYVVTTGELKQNVHQNIKKLRCPLILKPNFEGNSSGIVVCKTHKEACTEAICLLEKYNSPILCEEFILGKEITVPLIGNDPENMMFGITTVDIQKNDHFWLDVDTKMFGDYHNILLELPPQIVNQYKDICVSLFQAIGCYDFARFDFRMSSDNQIYFIEINPLPALFQGGSFDIVGQQYNYTFAQTLEKIVSEACKRQSIPKI